MKLSKAQADLMDKMMLYYSTHIIKNLPESKETTQLKELWLSCWNAVFSDTE